MYIWFTWLPPLPLFAISTKKKVFSSFFILLFCLRHSTCVSSVCMCLCLWVIREQIYYCRNDVVLILTAAHFTRAMQCSMKFQCEVNNKNNICLHFKKILFSRQPSDGTYERLFFFNYLLNVITAGCKENSFLTTLRRAYLCKIVFTFQLICLFYDFFFVVWCAGSHPYCCFRCLFGMWLNAVVFCVCLN